MNKLMQMRKIFVLREVEIESTKLRTGDVFRLEPADATDVMADPNEYYVCDAKPDRKFASRDVAVECHVVIPPIIGRKLNFKGNRR